MTYIF
jgi:hypothetical protein